MAYTLQDVIALNEKVQFETNTDSFEKNELEIIHCNLTYGDFSQYDLILELKDNQPQHPKYRRINAVLYSNNIILEHKENDVPRTCPPNMIIKLSFSNYDLSKIENLKIKIFVDYKY